MHAVCTFLRTYIRAQLVYQTGLCSRPIYREALILADMHIRVCVCVCVCVCMLHVVVHACMDQYTKGRVILQYVRSKPQAVDASVALHAILMSALIRPQR